ncbi:MAG TPA: toll/interleukin-1 receptor domain-containing protein, partial [Bryobacteraceae bacterium]|nr:toll/interleukin-1 receptor domain-containing protein [Bryobacteraceae bacterium]
DWDALYERHDLGAELERLRDEWSSEFDLVLIDSRTGVTDFSGLTTAQLPDVLAFLFTANAQSLEGCSMIVRRAMTARTRIPVDRPALLPLPIPARFEQRDEYERAKEWRSRFVAHLDQFFDLWKPRDIDALKLIDLLTIPYVPRWTFGEELAAIEEPAGTTGARTSVQAVTYTLETIAALLVHGFAKVEILVSTRDEYVHGARSVVHGWRASERPSTKVFVSYAKEDSKAVSEIVRVLNGAGYDLQLDLLESGAGQPWIEDIREKLENSDAYLVVVGSKFSPWQEREIESIMRQTLRSDRRRPIVPIVLPLGDKLLNTSRLADFAAVRVDLQRRAMEDQIAPVLDQSSVLK